jgi:hypothetical protein
MRARKHIRASRHSLCAGGTLVLRLAGLCLRGDDPHLAVDNRGGLS